MKKFILATALVVLGVADSRADVIVTFEEVGSNVVATGAGTLDLGGLTLINTVATNTGVTPATAELFLGPSTQNGNPTPTVDVYQAVSGPASWGSGNQYFRIDSGTGDTFGVSIRGTDLALIVPENYASGGALSAISVWENESLATMGLSPGSYSYSWGTNSNEFTIVVVAPVPEPSTALIVFAVPGALAFMRRRT